MWGTDPGDHLVVSIKGNKESNNCIAEVTGRERNGEILIVTFLRKSTKGNHFFKPSEDHSEIDSSQVVYKLPKATTIGGSARRQKMLQFGGAEKSFNVE